MRNSESCVSLLKEVGYNASASVMRELYDLSQVNKNLWYTILGGYEKQFTLKVEEKTPHQENQEFLPLFYQFAEKVENHSIWLNNLVALVVTDIFDTNQLALSDTQKKTIVEQAQEEGFSVINGMKLSANSFNMRFSKLLAKIDPVISDLFNQLRDIACRAQLKTYNVTISINPYHFFKMSYNNAFTSCYDISGGCYHGGITNYIQDNVTAILYMSDNEDSDYMTYRQLLHVDFSNQVIIIARPYPRIISDGFNKALRALLRKELFSVDNSKDWTFSDNPHNVAKRVEVTSSNTYVDVIKGSYDGVSITYPSGLNDDYKMRIASKYAMCIETGEEHYEEESLVARGGKYRCCHCGDRLHEDDARYWGDETYCTDCLSEIAFYCEHCDEYHSLDYEVSVNTRYGAESWCQDCANDYAFFCDDCEEWYASRSNNAHDVENGNCVCDSCLDNYFYCTTCGEWRDTEHYHSENLCQDCHESQEDQEGEQC